MVKQAALTHINETGVDVIWTGFSWYRSKMDSVVVDLMEETKKKKEEKWGERERKSKHELGKQAGMQANASNLSARQGALPQI